MADDYIKRQALLDLLNNEERCGYLDAQDIQNVPAEDVAPVVHCRDCKNYHEETGWCNEHSHFIDADRAFCHPWESADWKMFDPDDFCSYGERKDGG